MKNISFKSSVEFRSIYIISLVLVCLCVFPGQSWAKLTIYGTITDQNGKPLVGATEVAPFI